MKEIGMRIVVLHRGWVVVGRVSRTKDEVVISGASVIRNWGTTKGLGELRTGPTPKTVLDPVGLVRVHPLAVVLMIDVDEMAWSQVCQ